MCGRILCLRFGRVFFLFYVGRGDTGDRAMTVIDPIHQLEYIPNLEERCQVCGHAYKHHLLYAFDMSDTGPRVHQIMRCRCYVDGRACLCIWGELVQELVPA